MEKKKVIVALTGNEVPQKQYNELLQLFIKHPHHGPAQAKYYNASGFSKPNLDTLKYDVKKCYGITDAEVRNYVPEKKEESIQEQFKRETKELGDFLVKLLGNFEEMDYHKELKPLAVEVSNKFKHELPDMKTATLVAYLGEQKAKLLSVESEEVKPSKNIYADAPDEAKAGLKLRQEFPFLSEADCPDKFKILVADKFTALENYEVSFEEIQKKKSEGDTEGLFELGKKAVENFELNQEIYDELNYYQEHKEILGNHPIFADDMLVKTVNAYSTQEAMKRQGNLRSYISRDTKKLEEIKDAKKKENAETKLKEWQDELDLIDKRLNADAEKK